MHDGDTFLSQTKGFFSRRRTERRNNFFRQHNQELSQNSDLDSEFDPELELDSIFVSEQEIREEETRLQTRVVSTRLSFLMERPLIRDNFISEQYKTLVEQSLRFPELDPHPLQLILFKRITQRITVPLFNKLLYLFASNQTLYLLELTLLNPFTFFPFSGRAILNRSATCTLVTSFVEGFPVLVQTPHFVDENRVIEIRERNNKTILMINSTTILQGDLYLCYQEPLHSEVKDGMLEQVLSLSFVGKEKYPLGIFPIESGKLVVFNIQSNSNSTEMEQNGMAIYIPLGIIQLQAFRIQHLLPPITYLKSFN